MTMTASTWRSLLKESLSRLASSAILASIFWFAMSLWNWESSPEELNALSTLPGSLIPAMVFLASRRLCAIPDSGPVDRVPINIDSTLRACPYVLSSFLRTSAASRRNASAALPCQWFEACSTASMNAFRMPPEPSWPPSRSADARQWSPAVSSASGLAFSIIARSASIP